MAAKYNAVNRIKYTPELAARICDCIANGKSLSAVTRQPGMPKFSTVFQWLKEHPEFAEMYAGARDTQAEYFADEMQEIADTPVVATRLRKRGPNKRDWETIVGDNVERAKLQIDTRKWRAARQMPRKYGDWKRGSVEDEGKKKGKLDQLESIFKHGPMKTNGSDPQQ